MLTLRFLKICLVLTLCSVSTFAQKGKTLFETNCSSCHNFKQDGIGPQLGGLASQVDKNWLLDYIKDPQAKIDGGDKRSVALFKKYKVYMPGFSHIATSELNEIVDYIYAQAAPKQAKGAGFGPEILDPIPGKVQLSDLVLNIEPFTSIPFSGEKKLGTRISKMDFHPVTKENYILDLRGKLYRLNGTEPEVYLDMAAEMPHFVNQPGLATGFGSFAFHPDFGSNGLLYTTHTEAPGSAPADFAYADSIKVTLQWVVTEWKTNDPLAVPFKGTPRELFRVNVVTGIHGVQEITFNPLAKKGDADYGNLYIGVGDGGAVESGYAFIPNNTDHIWGCVLRIDPSGRNSENGKYGIPPSNPYAGTDKRGEIYAMGFRNPHRICWTSDGKMLVTNIGQKQIESINLLKPGLNFGWPYREGTFMLDTYGDLNKVYALPKKDKKSGYTYPVVQLDHDELNAISTGYEYTGNLIPELKGKFVFCSVVKGRLLYINIADLKQGKMAEVKEWKVAKDGEIVKFNELAGNNRVDLRFGRDANGELYLFTKPDGKVYRLVK